MKCENHNLLITWTRVNESNCLCVSFFLFQFSFVVVFVWSSKKQQRNISAGAAATVEGKQQLMPTQQRTWKHTPTIGDGEIDGHQRYWLNGWLVGLAAVRHSHTEALSKWMVFFRRCRRLLLIDPLGLVSIYIYINIDAEDWTLPRVTIRAFERRMFTHWMFQLVHKRCAMSSRRKPEVKRNERREWERNPRVLSPCCCFVCFFILNFMLRKTNTKRSKSKSNEY